MSYITNVLIQGAGPKEIEALNEWLRENDTDRQQQLCPVGMDEAGGHKHYVTDVWAAAFNYLPGGFLEKLRDPETWGNRIYLVAVVVDGENESGAFVFDKREGEYVRVTERED